MTGTATPSSRRWALLDVLRDVTTKKSCRVCSKFSATPDGVTVSLNPRGRASVGGVHTCDGSLCPLCSARKRAQQMAAVEASTVALCDQGHTVLLVTLTLPHSKNDSLPFLLDAMQKGWNASLSARGRKKWEAAGMVGYLRSLDYTHGQNGHHPHYHCVFYFDRVADPDDLWRLEGDLHDRWARSILKSTGRDTTLHAVDVQVADDIDAVTRYVAKSFLLESLWSEGKALGGRNIWAILAGSATSSEDRDLWRSLEDGFHRRRWVVAGGVVSLKLPEDDDVSDIDEDKSDGDENDEHELLCVVPPRLWAGLVQRRLVPSLLTAAETSRVVLDGKTTVAERWRRWLVLVEVATADDRPESWSGWLPTRGRW
ncbi:MAG: protein rep [Chlorobium phaeovibrioides]|nr:protein rep [Chlorobium phaeovibrioides]